MVFDVRFAGEISGLRISPLSVVLEPKFGIFHDLTFARAGVGPVLAMTRILIPRQRPSSATWFVRFNYG